MATETKRARRYQASRKSLQPHENHDAVRVACSSLHCSWGTPRLSADRAASYCRRCCKRPSFFCTSEANQETHHVQMHLAAVWARLEFSCEAGCVLHCFHPVEIVFLCFVRAFLAETAKLPMRNPVDQMQNRPTRFPRALGPRRGYSFGEGSVVFVLLTAAAHGPLSWRR